MIDVMNEIDSKMDLDHLRSLIIFLKDDIKGFEPKRFMSAYSEYDVLLDAKFGKDLEAELIEKQGVILNSFLKLIDRAQLKR
jgi:hypothetical protein